MIVIHQPPGPHSCHRLRTINKATSFRVLPNNTDVPRLPRPCAEWSSCWLQKGLEVGRRGEAGVHYL